MQPTLYVANFFRQYVYCHHEEDTCCVGLGRLPPERLQQKQQLIYLNDYRQSTFAPKPDKHETAPVLALVRTALKTPVYGQQVLFALHVNAEAHEKSTQTSLRF